MSSRARPDPTHFFTHNFSHVEIDLKFYVFFSNSRGCLEKMITSMDLNCALCYTRPRTRGLTELKEIAAKNNHDQDEIWICDAE